MVYAAVLVWGTVYVLIVAAAGLLWGNKAAVALAALTAGATYLCYFVQAAGVANMWSQALVYLTIALGALAGAALLLG